MLKNKFFHLNLKKSIAAAACITLICTLSVFAIIPDARASAMQYINKFVNGYTSMKDYNKTPSKEQIEKDLGYKVKILDSLPGGYKLINSSIIGNVNGSDPKNNFKNKCVGGTYTKDNTKESQLSFEAGKDGIEDLNSPIYKNAKTITVANTTAYWVEYTTHVIPRDVFNKMSQEEKNKIDNNVENGKEILITIASKSKDNNQLKEEQITSHSLKWSQNNVTYALTDENNNLNLEQMSQMAESIINSK